MVDMEKILQIEKDMLAPGGFFEVHEEKVLGEEMPVFKGRFPSLRSVVEASINFGDKEYIVYEDRRLTFAEHYSRVCAFARVLKEDYGICKGDRVAILGSNKPEWIITFWAAVSIGAIAVGLNGWWVADEVMWSLGDCEPKLLVGDKRRLARIKDEDPGIPVLTMEDDVQKLVRERKSDQLPGAEIHGDDAACILYTSGTTGRPKGAVLTHTGMSNSLVTQFFHGFRLLQINDTPPAENPAALYTNPLFHVSGLHAGAMVGLASGLKTVWTEGRFDPEKALDLIKTEKINAWSPMMTVAHRFATFAEEKGITVPEITSLGNGGAPMAEALLNKLRKVFPNASHSLALGYGMTESNAMGAINFGKEFEEKPLSSGRPMPTVAVEIRDIDGKKAGIGESGEIFIKSPMVMREYWNKSEATAQTILHGRWLATGDYGSIDEDGHVTINTRARDLILRGAENIYPVEIEHRLCEHPGVMEVAVLGVDNPEYGQEVKAFVVPNTGQALEEAELADWVGQKLAAYKVPTLWEIRSAPIPKTALGKMMKHLLVSDKVNPFVEE